MLLTLPAGCSYCVVKKTALHRLAFAKRRLVGVALVGLALILLSDELPGLFLPRLRAILVMYARDGLREVHFNTAVVDNRAVHLMVGLLARLAFVKLDERVLEAVSRPEVFDDVASPYFAETGEYHLQVSVLCVWV